MRILRPVEVTRSFGSHNETNVVLPLVVRVGKGSGLIKETC